MATPEGPRASTDDRKDYKTLFGTLCVFAASFTQQLDTTIVNIALPHMQGSVQASHEQISWILTSYIVATAIMTAPTASISTRIGRKTLFLICVAGFTASSVACGLAQSLDQLVFFRFLQGAAGGPLMPLGFAVVLETYTGRQRTKSLAAFSMTVAFGPIIGPVLGAYFTETLSWRWCFLVNLPIGALIFAGLYFFFHEERGKAKPMPFDVFGFSILSLGLAALQLMLDRGPTKDWFASTEIVIESVVAAVAFYVFVVHTATSPKSQFIPPPLFRDRNFILGTIASTSNVSLLYASSALLPVYLQTLGNHSVAETGLLLAPRGLGSIIVAFGGASLLAVFHARTVMTIGWALSAWSLWEMAHWTPDIGPWAVIAVSVIQGVSQSGLGSVNNAVCFSTVAPSMSNDATSVSFLLRHIGGAILISISATLLGNGLQVMHESIGAFVSPFNRNTMQGAAGVFWNPSTLFGAEQINREIARNAGIVAYSNTFLLLFAVSFGILFAALGLKLPRKSSPTPRPLEAAEV